MRTPVNFFWSHQKTSKMIFRWCKKKIEKLPKAAIRSPVVCNPGVTKFKIGYLDFTLVLGQSPPNLW